MTGEIRLRIVKDCIAACGIKWIIGTTKISALFGRVIILNVLSTHRRCHCVWRLPWSLSSRAKSVDQYSDWPAKLEHALATANIPNQQFETVEMSQPLSSPSDSSLRSPAITILSSVPRISSISIPPHYLTAASSSFSLLGLFLWAVVAARSLNPIEWWQSAITSPDLSVQDFGEVTVTRTGQIVCVET